MRPETFRQWRAHENLSLEKAAEVLGVHRSTIARYEAGAPIPPSIELATAAITAELSEPFGCFTRASQHYPAQFHHTHYVYHLVDPRTGLPFYVGKGLGGRVWTSIAEGFPEPSKSHSAGGAHKQCRAQEIVAAGYIPRPEIICLYPTAKDALAAEANEMLRVGCENLTNDWKGRRFGWPAPAQPPTPELFLGDPPDAPPEAFLRYRRQSPLTDVELAAAFALSLHAFYDRLYGHKPISTRTLKMLRAALGAQKTDHADASIQS